jgi:5-methylcytosine-specific restriction protein B
MWLMKITPNDSRSTREYFYNLFVKEGCKNLIGYTKEEGEKISSFQDRWNRIKIGDLIVVVEGYDRVFGVVEATSEPWDDHGTKDDNADWFIHRRNVKLIKHFEPSFKSKATTNRDTIIEYSGSGARSICDEVWNKIKDEYITLKKSEAMQDYIDILEHKKQIILQGPPGTGKTYTAEQIANVLTKEKYVNNPSNIIDQYFIKRKQATPEKVAIRQKLEGYISEFQNQFPKEELHSLPIERYAFGKGDNDTFCWWIEYGLYELGGYTGQAAKFKLFWKKSIDSYSKSGFVKDILDDQQAMSMIAEQLQRVADEQDLVKVSEKLSNGFILKVLHSYYPDKYFPINNEKCLNNALKLLNKSYDELNIFQKSILLQQSFLEKKAEFEADVTNYEFMRFLFGNFDMKGTISINNDQLVTKGEYKLIQFHPAYSYEDFVRGITVQTKGENQLEYITVNKVLAKFAASAIDNPTANYALIIDEINRANLPAVLGELIYALEYRGISVESMYELEDEGNKLVLPENLFIIGTMNTADRSVGHIDYAIRRRFAFKNVLPNYNLVHPIAQKLFGEVSKLFIKDFETTDWSEPKVTPSEYLAADFSAEDVWIGHSYFMSRKEKESEAKKELELKLNFEIKPLLKEYMKDGIIRSDITLGGAKDTLDYINKLSL